MAKYLNYEGLQTLWAKIKTWVASSVTTNSPSASKTITGFSEGHITYGNIAIAQSQVNNLTTDLGNKAPKASPAFTGTPTAPTAATGTDNTQIATTAFVNAEILSKIAELDAVVYKGTLAGGSTGDYGALTPAADKGAYYVVSTAGKIDGVAVEIGDVLICNTDNTAAATSSTYSTIKNKWDWIQANRDGMVIGPASAVDGRVVTFDGTTGKLIKDSGKTIGKSVPSDAVFTDTKVTSAGNHYTPAKDSGSTIDLNASGATAAWSIDVVTGVTLERDSKGHVTGMTIDSGKIPGNPNSDTKVTQNLLASTTDANYPLIAKNSTTATDSPTSTVNYAAGVTVNPKNKSITATSFIGNLTGTATSASNAAAGSNLETAINSKVPNTRKVNNKALSSDISLTYTDVGAASSGHSHDISLVASGTSTVDLLHNTTYTLTAGDQSVVFKTPTDSNTDTKVTQSKSTTSGNYPVIVKYDANTTNVTNTVNYATGVTVNPSNNKITASGFVGPLEGTANTAKAYDTSFTGTNSIKSALDGKMPSDHTYSIALATDTGTAAVAMSANTTYKLTAGGSSIILKTPKDSDTKNTAGSSNTSSKIFLVGATSQATSPQTYSHDTAYVGTDGCVYSNSQKTLTVNVASATYEPIITPISDQEIENLS